MKWHHRTGPAYRGTYHTVEDDSGQLIAECYEGSEAQQAKNANLIAAAPDMLTALERVLRTCGELSVGVQLAVEQAVAKATGQPVPQ